MAIDHSHILKALEEYKNNEHTKWHEIISSINFKADEPSIFDGLLSVCPSLEPIQADQLMKKILEILETNLNVPIPDSSNELLIILVQNHSKSGSILFHHVADFIASHNCTINNTLTSLIECILESLPMSGTLILDNLTKFIPTWIKSADFICSRLNNIYDFIFNEKFNPLLPHESLHRVFKQLGKQITELDLNRKNGDSENYSIELDESNDLIESISHLSTEVLTNYHSKCDIVGYFVIKKLKSLPRNNKLIVIKPMFTVFFDVFKISIDLKLMGHILFAMVSLWPKFLIPFVENLLNTMKDQKCNPKHALSILCDFACHSHCQSDLLVECLKELSSHLLCQTSHMHEKFYHTTAMVFFSILLAKHSQLLESPCHLRAVSKLGISKILFSIENPLKHLAPNMKQIVMEMLSAYDLNPCFPVKPGEPINSTMSLDSILIHCKNVEFILLTQDLPLTNAEVKQFFPPFVIGPKFERNLRMASEVNLKAGMKRPSTVAFDLSRLSTSNKY